MSAPNVGVNHAAFLQYQGQYADLIPAIKAIASNLDSSVQAAQGAWTGQAYTAFVNFATQLDQAIQTLNGQLQPTADALFQGNKVLGQQDYDSTSTFTSLGNNFDF